MCVVYCLSSGWPYASNFSLPFCLDIGQYWVNTHWMVVVFLISPPLLDDSLPFLFIYSLVFWYIVCSVLIIFVFGGYLGIVTRRPLVLQLHRLGTGEQEFSEFRHLPKKRFTDFGGYCAIDSKIFLSSLVSYQFLTNPNLSIPFKILLVF